MINNINNIPMLDRMTSDKDSYKKEEYYKGYKIPIISDTMFKTMINNTDRKQYASLLISIVLKKDYKEIYESLINANIINREKDELLRTGFSAACFCKNQQRLAKIN